jgi:hypothetical protein
LIPESGKCRIIHKVSAAPISDANRAAAGNPLLVRFLMKLHSPSWSRLLLMVLGQTGCHHYGPRSIVADRVPYNEAVAVSWKEQTLLNVVKLRYMDTPFFVDVPQITSGYTLQGTATTNGGIFPRSTPWPRSRSNSG